MVNPEDLEEGDDIYFSCSIMANPPAYKITWWHNVRDNTISIQSISKKIFYMS